MLEQKRHSLVPFSESEERSTVVVLSAPQDSLSHDVDLGDIVLTKSSSGKPLSKKNGFSNIAQLSEARRLLELEGPYCNDVANPRVYFCSGRRDCVVVKCQQ